jgi:hypothetical protein
MRRPKLTLDQLVYLSERKTARYMGVTLKQYRKERDALTEALGLTEKKSGIYHQRRERGVYVRRRQTRRSETNSGDTRGLDF